MQFILTILLLVGLTGNVIAHQPIPWVQSVASSVISEFSPAVVYRGPTGNSSLWRTTRTSSTPTPTPTPPAPYWLEDIKHQGIAAFNPNSSSYQVFRNVKDFGAKGDQSPHDFQVVLTIFQAMVSQTTPKPSTSPLAPVGAALLVSAHPQPLLPRLSTSPPEPISSPLP